MDKIILKNIEIFANHGVFSEEKSLGQKFILDLEISINLKEAGISGDLNKSINYGELCHKIEEVFKIKSYDLIETVAEKIAEYVLYSYEVAEAIKVTLKKPWAPIGRHLDYAAVEIERRWHEVYLSIGSNIGDKEQNLNEAIKRMEAFKEIKVEKVSSFIVTEPWGYVDQEAFLNGAVKIKTTFSSKELVKVLLSVENDMKRKRVVKWGPRIIDLDIIFYDNLLSEDEEIILPHPRMEEREFVLKPLCEIAPNKIHPLLNKRVYKLLDELTCLPDNK